MSRTERPIDLGQREEARVADASRAAGLDRARRHVDRDDVEAPALSLEAVPACSGSDVEDAAPNELEGRLLRLHPVGVLGEEPFGPERRPDLAVVALELGLARAPHEVVLEKAPKSVFVRVQDPCYAASEVRRPSFAAIGRIAATTFVMWSSSSRPSSSAPR